MKRETRLRPARGGRFFGGTLGLTPMTAAVAITAPIGIEPRATECDCGDPRCALPRGRCFLCKCPVVNERVYAVCSECDDAHEIRAAWGIDYGEEEARHDRHALSGAERECFCPGWLWMNEDDDASFNIERCDCCAAYCDDLEAAAAMVARAKIRGIEWP